MAKLEDYAKKFQDHDRVYKNKQVFNPNWTPEETEMIKHRDKQMGKYSTALADFIYSDMNVGRFLVGPNSTGKSLLIKFWKRALPKILDGSKDVKYTVFPCGSVNSWRDLGSMLADRLDITQKMKNNPAGYFSKIFQKMDKSKKYIFVFDEIDKLTESTRSEIVTIFSRPSDLPGDYPDFFVVVAGNDISTIQELDWGRDDNTHTSAFDPNIIDFNSYSFEQVKDIIEPRFKQGLKEELYEDKLVYFMARRITQNLNSDIRLGLKAIENSISHFRSSSSDKLSKEHIEKGVYDTTENSIRSKLNVISNKHAILLCKILADFNGNATAQELVDEYKKRLGGYDLTGRAKSSIYNYLKKLVDYNILQVDKTGQRNKNEYLFRSPYNAKIVSKAIKESGNIGEEF